MSGIERQTICFSETGISAPTDDVERVALTDGTVFVVQRIEIRPSSNTVNMSYLMVKT